jgi:Rad3-related DNA helicase
MLTKESLMAHFPFAEVRPVQADAMEKIARTCEEGKKFTILEMPTGSGKSGLAIAVCGAAAELPKVDQFNPGAHITTSQIILQRQYMRDFESMGLKELKGKGNYMCNEFEGGGVIDCAAASSLHGEEDACKACTYNLARQAYLGSPYGVTNFAYFTTIRKAAQEKGLPSRQLLIIDEAHNTESELIGFGEVDITPGRLGLLDLDKFPVINPDWPLERKISDCKLWFEKTVLPRLREKRLHFMSKAHQAQDRQTMVKLVKMAENLEQFQHKIKGFMESGEDEPWVVYNQTGPRGIVDGLSLKPLFANRLAEQYLFNAGRHVLMLSATILGPRVFARNLGIDIENLGFKRFASDFPVSNRPIFVQPAGSMSYKNIDGTLPKMVRAVEKICKANRDEKGIIHTNSYKVTKAIVEHLESCGLSDRVVTHNSDRGSREVAVAKHLNSEIPTILISPSLTEGLDLAGDLSRWQVMTKCPYPALGDLWIKERMTLDSEWYTWKTCLTLVQASGRSVRSKEDHARTYLLDSDFARLLNQGDSMLPGWWKDSISY